MEGNVMGSVSGSLAEMLRRLVLSPMAMTTWGALVACAILLYDFSVVGGLSIGFPAIGRDVEGLPPVAWRSLVKGERKMMAIPSRPMKGVLA